MITSVTISGADDSVKPKDLLELNKEFPFVEWGILLSRKQAGNFRYPSRAWLEELYNYLFQLKLSGHLCGSYVRELLNGDETFIRDFGSLWTMFERIQINFYGLPQVVDSTKMIDLLLLFEEKEFIFQIDNINNHLIKEAYEAGVNCSALFDLSHGTGVLPSEWPLPFEKIRCGYAGGLSSENLKDQIFIIEQRVGDTNVWIDMESHVRSNNDSLFDLSKARKCLEISSSAIVREPY
ncbi:MAG TPA: hypothetical protein VGQ59_11860 [Cyclobacteriaceae bacterium]|jgi:hypothetical protein|nr:hypothetical protein [Cyclobacteriaceae bacterium]